MHKKPPVWSYSICVISSTVESNIFALLCVVDLCPDGSLMSKDSLPTQSTTLEALLRGEGLDKRNNSKNDEESLLEIQVGHTPGTGHFGLFTGKKSLSLIRFSFQSHNC